MVMTENRADKSIEQMEADAETVPAPKAGEGDDPWAGEGRAQDEFSDRDGEARVRIYSLSIPNKPTKDGNPNLGFRRLCLDKDYAIAPRDVIRCVVLHRTLPKLAQIPYKEAEKLPKDEPWRKYLGYSMNGISPSPDSQGNCFSMCVGPDKKSWAQCSSPSVFKDGEVVEVPLEDGECPWGRWGNSMIDADRTRFKIANTDTPECNDQVVLYCWDLDLMIPFIAYFKITSISSARDFIASCSRNIGGEVKEYPFYAFVAQIIIDDKGQYVVPKIVNTNQYTEPAKIKPIIGWFVENKEKFVRNLSLQMEDAKKKKAEKDSAADFNPAEYE
jgi:hypothetical protein